MENEPNITPKVINGLTKVWFYIGYIVIGIVGMFSYNISTGKKITLISAIASIGVAGFVGYIASVTCYNRGWEEQARYVVPICTLASEKIIVIFYKIDWSKFHLLLTDIFHKEK